MRGNPSKRHAPRIIDFLRVNEPRFTELQRAMGDVNSVTLSNRLKRLEAAGVIERKAATIDRQSVAYRLTGLGKGVLPVLREIQNFTKLNARLGSTVGVPSGEAGLLSCWAEWGGKYSPACP
ncbi:MAG: helix-turn-helix domain-containing protein [Spirochaetia bacterium]